MEPKPPCPRAVPGSSSTASIRMGSNSGHHELGDAIAAGHDKGLGAEIDEQHHHFAAIVGIDGAGTIEHRHAGLKRKARARADLSFAALGQFDDEPGGHEGTRAWGQRKRLGLG